MSCLDEERARASFREEEMTEALFGDAEAVQTYRDMQQLVEAEPDFAAGPELYHLGQVGHYVRGLRMFKRAQELRHEHDFGFQEMLLLRELMGGVPSTSYDLHDVFLANVMGLGNDQQQAELLPAAMDYEIIGCYAQTELGHGSNVRGLETTATFVPESQEWELHSPTLSSTKFWPGNMGRTATHAVVYARLLSQGRDHGVHSFVVQIRDLETHAPVPGVTAGDIGPKMGGNMVDNGWLRFDRVRVPRSALLAKHARVSREGEYSTPPRGNARASYGTMLLVRAAIVTGAYSALAKALTIAVRYSCVRRQGSSLAGSGEPGAEPKVLDYQAQQMRLLPLVAAAYAMRFTGHTMQAAMSGAMGGGDSGQTQQELAELHAASSGLKALTTDIAADGIEAARKACGGHGFLLFSGLPTLANNYLMNNTVEGENFVIAQQTSRHLVKQWKAARGGERVYGSASYLGAAAGAAPAGGPLSSAWQMWAYEARARFAVEQAAAPLAAGSETWNGVQWAALRASRAHCLAVLVRNFQQHIAARTAAEQPALVPVLSKLCSLFALRWLQQDLGEFLEAGAVRREEAPGVHAAVAGLLRDLRPDAVALVDAFAFSDHTLNSAIGRRDGRAYETLFEWAKTAPLNRPEESPELQASYAKYIKPLLSGEVQSRL